MSHVAVPLPVAVPLSRRELVRRLAVVVAGVGVAACAPLRIALKAYPEQFGTDADLVERTLRAFVLTVVPGAAPDDPGHARVFADTFHPFGPHRACFAADLCSRAERRFGESRFDRLPPDGRTWVVRRGLRQRGVIGRMYAGAVLLAQVAVYGGIHDDSRGCPLIGFDGGGRVPTPAELTYPDAERFLARPLTATGNLS